VGAAYRAGRALPRRRLGQIRTRLHESLAVEARKLIAGCRVSLWFEPQLCKTGKSLEGNGQMMSRANQPLQMTRLLLMFLVCLLSAPASAQDETGDAAFFEPDADRQAMVEDAPYTERSTNWRIGGN